MSDSNDDNGGCIVNLLITVTVIMLMIIQLHCHRMDKIQQQLDSIEKRLEAK
jgi:preprotein translocase subunit YajC